MGDVDESAKLWKVNRTIHELVKDRGFAVSDDEIHLDLPTFKATYASESGVVELLGILEEKTIQRGIIVFPGNMTPSARKVIVAMSSQYRLEEFSESDLLVNIVHHALVPRHDVLSPEEKKLLLEKYSRLKETQLPRIQLADPVARYYGLRRGQVVKITRPSETSGRCKLY
ncbi:hypothetical protein DXG01_014220 [Tephrocybe rancida]|nr:hypothetical protein DXG01_014220 [Tephrocybe rancida]